MYTFPMVSMIVRSIGKYIIYHRKSNYCSRLESKPNESNIEEDMRGPMSEASNSNNSDDNMDLVESDDVETIRLKYVVNCALMILMLSFQEAEIF